MPSLLPSRTSAAPAPLTHRGQRVLITGASSGIGAAFARRLAAEGSDLVLVARRAERLEDLARELASAHGADVEVIAADLAAPDASAGIRDELARRGVRVTALIHSAGFAHNAPLVEIDPADLREEIAVDVVAVADLTRLLLPDLLDAPSGYLVTLASVAAYQPNPLMAVYGASKAFVLSFTEALAEECRGTSLRVLAVSPGPVATEFFEVAGEAAGGGLPRTSSEAVVDATLAALGRRSVPPSIVVGAANRAMTTAGRLVPRRVVGRAVGTLMRRAKG